MPELPEVETTRRGIEPHILGNTLNRVVVRNASLRWPVPRNLSKTLAGMKVESLARRGKYLLLGFPSGSVIIHLGMSGSLRIVDCDTAREKHDHVEFVFQNNKCLRLRDPRRFGAVLYTTEDPLQHKLLANLGPEPLQRAFSGRHLYDHSRGKKVAVKLFIMNSKIVVGVGNIYANEALFLAGIHPKRIAGRLSAERYDRLAQAIKKVLRAAIKSGGTTLRDFTAEDGRPGYFQQKLNVYGKAGEPCPGCGTPIKHITLGQRATYFCPHCQT
ncbi:MAG: bifunctional DNA-formamidopyrimidine glycosylase/DNA-(apurinic or apyrimidinic site) lyase [Gammaproteobacteria bacterium]|nr:bifunctional DNA-formamidopyrimidine glycosylase/DNA-(apurinic or apyrimidinic site) lyase [Gammaproteobacteria bacterium]